MQSIALSILLESVIQFAEENTTNKRNMIGNINFEEKKPTTSIFVVYFFKDISCDPSKVKIDLYMLNVCIGRILTELSVFMYWKDPPVRIVTPSCGATRRCDSYGRVFPVHEYRKTRLVSDLHTEESNLEV